MMEKAKFKSFCNITNLEYKARAKLLVYWVLSKYLLKEGKLLQGNSDCTSLGKVILIWYRKLIKNADTSVSIELQKKTFSCFCTVKVFQKKKKKKTKLKSPIKNKL